MNDQASKDTIVAQNFVELGTALANALTAAAEAQVTEAANLAEQAKAVVANIHAQITELTLLQEDLNAKFKNFGAKLLEAHPPKADA